MTDQAIRLSPLCRVRSGVDTPERLRRSGARSLQALRWAWSSVWVGGFKIAGRSSLPQPIVRTAAPDMKPFHSRAHRRHSTNDLMAQNEWQFRVGKFAVYDV
jgi:hypothetical protein